MPLVVSRAIALVGVALGLAAIWIEFGGGNAYWDTPGHSVGIAMLVLAVVAGLGIVAASLLRNPALDRLWWIAGLPLGGLLLFIPVGVLGQSQAGALDSGAWLGFAAFWLIVVAAALSAVTGPPPAPPRAQPPAEPPASPPA